MDTHIWSSLIPLSETNMTTFSSTNTTLFDSTNMTTLGSSLLPMLVTDLTTPGTFVPRPLRDGYRFTVFLHKVHVYNDTSDKFLIVFRPSYLRGSTNMSLFCLDIAVQFVGILGNLLSVYVLAHRSLRSSTSLLLSSMAVYDSIFLLTMLGTMLNEVLGQRSYYYPGECTAISTILQTSGMASVFTVVAVTVERYIAVRKPMKARMFCTSCAACKAIVLIIGLSFVASIPRFLQLYGADDDMSADLGNCAESSEKSMAHLFYCSLFPIVFILIIPFLIISVLNVCILKDLIHRNRNLKDMSGAGNIVNGDKLTCATLGTSSFFFLCCTFPAIYITIDGIRPDITDAMNDIVGDICSSLVILNFSANFLFYCFLGRAFRTVLLEHVCCQVKQPMSETQTSLHRKRLSSERATNM